MTVSVLLAAEVAQLAGEKEDNRNMLENTYHKLLEELGAFSEYLNKIADGSVEKLLRRAGAVNICHGRKDRKASVEWHVRLMLLHHASDVIKLALMYASRRGRGATVLSIEDDVRLALARQLSHERSNQGEISPKC